MILQKERRAVCDISFIGLLLVFSLFCFNEVEGNSNFLDYTFLYNRCYQMFDCFRHGEFPFLYYNDFGGVGYGTPIFYGQLTLVPFMLFLGSISTFVKVYFLCCLLLNFFAFRFFLKRFSCYATLTSCFYIFSMLFMCFCGDTLPAFTLSIGFSWLFLGYCVDFFRDGKGFVLLILTYFLIWQTNLNGAILATVACFFVFVVYFRRDRWRDYCKLFFVVLAVIAYDIVNILIHLDALRFADLRYWIEGSDHMGDSRGMLSVIPFGGYLFRAFANVDRCCGLMPFGVLIFVLGMRGGVGHWSRRAKVVSCVGLCACVAGYVIGCCYIWPTVYDSTEAFFQFPIRYFVFLFGFLLVLLSRVIRPGRFVYAVLVLSLIDIVIAGPMLATYRPIETPYEFVQVAQCEYAGKTFIRDGSVYEVYSSGVISLSGEVYDWSNEYNGVLVDCSVNSGGDVLTLPKLYYRGYSAFGENGETFAVRSGFSNYCEVSIGDYQGRLRLVYRVPFGVMCCFVLQIIMISGLCCLLLRDLFERRSGRLCVFRRKTV